jgi:ATP-dependent Clp protease ATP-binding subunit ClpC
LFERFTESARQVVVAAADEARALGDDRLGTEHLLFGLLRDMPGHDPLARRILTGLGATRDEPLRVEPEGAGQIPFTPDAKRSLEAAVEAADARRHGVVGTEHILLGLARADGAVFARIGVDAAQVEAEVRKLIGEAH